MKVKETATAAKNRLPKLQSELDALKSRRQNPQEYEDKLDKEIKEYVKAIAILDNLEIDYTTTNKAGNRVKRRDLTSDEEAKLADIRNSRKGLIKERGKVEKSLEEHRSFMSADADIKKWDKVAEDLNKQAKSINLKIKKYPTARFTTKEEAENAKFALIAKAKSFQLKVKSTQKWLDKKGSIDEQIRKQSIKLDEAQKLSQLTEESALKLYEKTNGFFSFDKGSKESEDYSKSRPKMNSEIHKLNAREATEYLEQKYGDKTIETLQDLARKSYKRNLNYNLEVIVDKVQGVV